LIIEAFLRWFETANAKNRSDAASALGLSFNHTELDLHERQAAQVALTYLLDDPSPKVRLSLAQSLANDLKAPRAVILALADDVAEIANTVISRSPLLSDTDLIDIAHRAGASGRAAIAARPHVSAVVTAAFTEIGEPAEIELLLKNQEAQFSGNVLLQLARRLGDDGPIREILLARTDLPAAARQVLIEKVGETLANWGLVQASLTPRKIERVRREACDAATINVISAEDDKDIERVVEHLRKEGRLTTAFLIHALCAGKTVFFAESISNLSGVARVRARSILASGRTRAVRALVEAAGISHSLSPIFCEAVTIWRQESGDMPGSSGIFSKLAEKCRMLPDLTPEAVALTDIVERLALTEMRQFAYRYAQDIARDAA
jgi:uncharacterized protein (DUF2336 family)